MLFSGVIGLTSISGFSSAIGEGTISKVAGNEKTELDVTDRNTVTVTTTSTTTTTTTTTGSLELL